MHQIGIGLDNLQDLSSVLLGQVRVQQHNIRFWGMRIFTLTLQELRGLDPVHCYV